jgi:two-component system sensor histidine kinase YesM
MRILKAKVEQIRKLLHSGSLKNRLIMYLLIGSLLPLTMLGLITYYSTYSILENKIQSGITASLTQEAIGLENTINNMDFASKQFSLDGRILETLQTYFTHSDSYERAAAMSEVQNVINTVNYTNPYLGLTFYYVPKESDRILFENSHVKPEFSETKLPHYTNYNGGVYYGPHTTMYRDGSNIVFSNLRKVNVSDRDVYIYLETNFNLFRKLIYREAYGIEVSHLLTNNKGEIIYTDNWEPSNSQDSSQLSDAILKHDKRYKGYMLFSFPSTQGWELTVAVKRSVFYSEINRWLIRFGVLMAGALFLSLLMAYGIWKMMYRPLQRVKQEIILMRDNRSTNFQYTRVSEFDLLLRNFWEMRQHIGELNETVMLNEKNKSRLEIEKLLIQINPHFLHNTLNTVQWLARMNGQKEIDRLVTLLAKVLHYNLGKQSIIVPISEEIEALRNYVELQQIRYDYEFVVHIEVDPSVDHVLIPRFLLQPLVENAIYHGSSERNGAITILVTRISDAQALLRVTDNGEGMNQEAIAALINNQDITKKRGLGIGLHYVNQLVKKYFGSEQMLQISSEVGMGTTIDIIIPIRTKEELEDA